MRTSVSLLLLGCTSEPVAPPPAAPEAPVAVGPEVAPTPLAAVPAGARTADGVRVKEAYARAMPPGAPNSAAFLTLQSPVDGRLVAARATIADAVELHTHVDEGGVMQMRRVDGIDLPAGEVVEMTPGGLHVMFVGLRGALKAGESFELTLVFADGSEHALHVPIQEIAAGHD